MDVWSPLYSLIDREEEWEGHVEEWEGHREEEQEEGHGVGRFRGSVVDYKEEEEEEEGKRRRGRTRSRRKGLKERKCRRGGVGGECRGRRSQRRRMGEEVEEEGEEE